MYITSKDVQVEFVAEGVKRQVMGYDTELMLVRVLFEKRGIGSEHKHPHQQVSYVESGKFEVTIAGKTQILTTGDCFVVPSNALHGAICLEAGVLIDTFSPVREDFL